MQTAAIPMDRSGPPVPRGRAVLAVVGVWLGVGLLSASQYYLAARTNGQDGAWALQLLREVPPWQVWSLLTPAVILLARRFPLARGRLRRHLPVHVAGALGGATIYLACWVLWTKVALPSYGDMSVSALFWAIFRARFNVAFLLYWGIVGVFYALWNNERLRAREVEAARARLDVLRSQLHPHFLFNTLHSIASLMDEDVSTARRLIARLSDLLRTTLEVAEFTEVPLADEIEFLEQYLEIERVRFDKRLRIEYDIAPGTLVARIPPLLLQPLVENAVRHGIAPIETGGTVSIRARDETPWLVLEVRDTGPGLDGRRAEGIGLGNTRERLARTYAAHHTFEVDAADGGGVTVRIRIPLHAGHVS